MHVCFQLFTSSLIHSFTHSLIPRFNYSIIQSFIHSLMYGCSCASCFMLTCVVLWLSFHGVAKLNTEKGTHHSRADLPFSRPTNISTVWTSRHDLALEGAGDPGGIHARFSSSPSGNLQNWSDTGTTAQEGTEFGQTGGRTANHPLSATK